jgi:hypothetical protein
MKFHAKRRLVKLSLVVLAVWPLLHIALVRSTGISPWRGFGWAMYTVPVLAVEVGFRPLEGQPGETTRGGKEAAVRALKRYLKHYQALGGYASADHLARTVFAAYPGYERIEISVKQHALDRKTARIVEHRNERLRYRRDGEVERVP